jgi:hypothetical protein
MTFKGQAYRRLRGPAGVKSRPFRVIACLNECKRLSVGIGGTIEGAGKDAYLGITEIYGVLERGGVARQFL